MSEAKALKSKKKTEEISLRVVRASNWSKEERDKRIEMLKNQNFSLENLTGEVAFEDFPSLKGNIENFIGFSQVPTGLAGPVKIEGMNANGEFYVPLATSEGTLVISINRGLTVINYSGGAKTAVLKERVSRTPYFSFKSVNESLEFSKWVCDHSEELKASIQKRTQHGKLCEVEPQILGNKVYLILAYHTADASGQNMVTSGSEAVLEEIARHCPVKPQYAFIEGNLSGDKKATNFSYQRTRGKQVVSEVLIPKKVCKRLLAVQPEELYRCFHANLIGGVQSGSIGVNGHFANALTALFLACGQDVACVSEASVGISNAEVTPEGDFYLSVTLPNMIVGTVGGGCGLPTQRECLEIMGCYGSGKSGKFAEICATAVLAGEISLLAAVASGNFARAHNIFGRNRPKELK